MYNIEMNDASGIGHLLIWSIAAALFMFGGWYAIPVGIVIVLAWIRLSE